MTEERGPGLAKRVETFATNREAISFDEHGARKAFRLLGEAKMLLKEALPSIRAYRSGAGEPVAWRKVHEHSTFFTDDPEIAAQDERFEPLYASPAKAGVEELRREIEAAWAEFGTVVRDRPLAEQIKAALDELAQIAGDERARARRMEEALAECLRVLQQTPDRLRSNAHKNAIGKARAALSDSPASAALAEHKWLDPECGVNGCQSLVWKSLYESAVKGRSDFREAYREARASAARPAVTDDLRTAAKNLMPYLRWTISAESPGHHPTLPSAMHALEAALSQSASMNGTQGEAE